MMQKFLHYRQAIFAATLYVLSAMLALAAIVQIVFSFGWDLIWDQAFMHYIAWCITDGAVPYRDIFDINFPLAYLIHIFIITVLGDGDVGWRVFDISCLAIISLLSALYCRRFGRLCAVLAPILFASFHLSNGPLLAGQRDYYLLVFVMGGLLCLAAFFDRQRIRGVLGAGILLGAAVCIKPFVGALCVMCAGGIAVNQVRLGRSWGAPLFFCAGTAVFPLMMAIWLAAIGGLGPFIRILSDFTLGQYARIDFVPTDQWLYVTVAGMPLVVFLSAIFVLEGLHICNGADNRLRRILLLAGMVYGVCHYVLQARFSYQRYPVLFFSFLVLASWFVPQRVAASSAMTRVRRLFAVYCIAGLLYVPVYRIAVHGPYYQTKGRVAIQLVADLQGIVPAGGTVQILETFGGGMHALLLMKCRQPTRFVTDMQFYRAEHDPYIAELRRELLAGLQATPPDCFVLMHRSYPSGYDRIERLPGLAEWLENRYALHCERDAYRVYIRR